MKCNNIRLLLDEYINNTLDDKKRSLVEKHLKSCKNCQNELEYLIKYFSLAKNIPQKEAPGNFLDNINKKISEKTFIDRIKNTFLYPVKIKAPIEIFGLLSTAILIFILLNPFNITLGVKNEKISKKQALTEGENSFSGKESLEDESKLIESKKINSADKKIAMPAKDNITYVDSIQKNETSKSKKKETAPSYNIALNIIDKNISDFPLMEKTDSDKSLRSIEPKYRMKKSLAEESSKTTISGNEKIYEEEKDNAYSNYRQNEVYTEIEKIITDMGGKINLEDSSIEKNIINIVISEAKYETLIVKLQERGKIETLKEKQENKSQIIELNLILE